jgi:sec-independent protein translocase protein TatA
MAFIGPWEIALILAIVLIIFGPKKLPELAKSVGDAIKQYREASEGKITAPGSEVSPAVARTQETNLLLETAKNLGIKTEGKTMEQISKEIQKKGQKSIKKSSKKSS